MRSKCPIKELLQFIKDTKNNPQNKIPQKILKHAKTCEKCSEILGKPELWDAFININETLNNTSKQNDLLIVTPKTRKNEYKNIKEGMVCRIKIDNTLNFAFVLITDVSNLNENGFIRISPIAVSPQDEDIDFETDIIIPASNMPNGLPSLIEWWNDRPILANSINKVLGSISTDDYKKIKQELVNQPRMSKSTKSVLIFREIEKNKGNQMSASFFDKFVSEESIAKETICVRIFDLFPTNEELKLAAASKDIYTVLKEYLKNNYPDDYEATKIDDGSNSFTISSVKGKEFILEITDKNNKIEEIKSNPKGKLYLKEGLEDFEKIELRQ